MNSNADSEHASSSPRERDPAPTGFGLPRGTRSRALADAPEAQRALARMRLELAAMRKRLRLADERNTELVYRLCDALKAEAEAYVFANRDELTGLPNRRLLKDRVRQAAVHAHRHGEQFALLLLDLDGFKEVNDAFGHLVGDELLRMAAQRLVSALRASDTVCRFGGDEFVIVVPDLEGPAAVLAVIEKIRECLAGEYTIQGRRIASGASIGCALYPRDGLEYADLIAAADAAMYGAKRRQGPRLERFT